MRADSKSFASLVREVDYKPKPIDSDFLSKPTEYPVTGEHEGHSSVVICELLGLRGLKPPGIGFVCVRAPAYPMSHTIRVMRNLAFVFHFRWRGSVVLLDR
jgi:hypothetical protein